MIISERASFYQFVQRIRFLFKKKLEVILLDVYNYNGFHKTPPLAGSIRDTAVTAGLGLIQYRSYDPAVHWNIPACFFSILASFLISVVFEITTKKARLSKLSKKQKKGV